MTKSRAEPRGARGAALLAVAALVGCGVHLALPGTEVWNHPAPLVGQWVDAAKTVPGDSSIWVLDARGNDETLRIVRDSATGRVITTRRHYGYWYAGHDADGYAFCVTRRPGRDPAQCTSLAAGVDSSVTPARRRVVLRAYHGAHSIGERVLVERR